jgi:hypothetical protein
LCHILGGHGSPALFREARRLATRPGKTRNINLRHPALCNKEHFFVWSAVIVVASHFRNLLQGRGLTSSIAKAAIAKAAIAKAAIAKAAIELMAGLFREKCICDAMKIFATSLNSFAKMPVCCRIRCFPGAAYPYVP